MIKKLMNIPGAQILSQEEQKKVFGGKGWIAVCANGEKFDVGDDAEMALILAEYTCEEIDNLYCFGSEC